MFAFPSHIPQLKPESATAFDDHTCTPFEYILTHVLSPVQLPEKNDYTPENDLSLLRAVCTAARAYAPHVCGPSASQWLPITKMLDDLLASMQSGDLSPNHSMFMSKLRGMQTGDISAFFIRHRDEAVIIRKQDDRILVESLEISPSEYALWESGEALMCSYPGSTAEIPSQVFSDAGVQSEIADFLSRRHAHLPLLPPGDPYNVVVRNLQCSVGRVVDMPRITKRIYGNDDPMDPWRRSSLWLFIRIAIQTSFDRSAFGRTSYKQFMLFFLCTLARDREFAHLSRELHHLMACKILRRLGKLGTSTPKWLSEMAFKTCAFLREILDAGWKQPRVDTSPFRTPSQNNLIRDSEFFFPRADEYIRNALANNDHKPTSSPFHPNHRCRGTIEDFLSSNGTFLAEALEDDPDVTVYDVEQAIEQGIDDWVANVTDVDEACVQIEILMDKYLRAGLFGQSEVNSITLFAGIELFLALDKLACRVTPILADYSPEIPIEYLEKLSLRSTTSLHRLAQAYQYLSARYSRSQQGWSVLSDEFNQDSFPVRYYDQSVYHRHLKVRIEGDMVPLPNSTLLAKVVVFELHCPPCIRIWRSAIPRVLHFFSPFYDDNSRLEEKEEEKNLLAHIPGLQRYFSGRDEPSFPIQIHLSYFCPQDSRSHTNPTLHYALRYPSQLGESLKVWRPRNYDDRLLSFNLGSNLVRHYSCSSCRVLAKYADSISHTSNDILAAQADCPADLSLDEFVAFAHLRSGGSLQWFNILQALRSRVLNFRHHQVFHLVAQAALQVGPLDLTTGTWIWHQELHDISFCNALLDELQILFLDVGAGSIDAMVMNIISLLLTRILSSSPSEGISDRAILLLRKVRSKTFGWIEELSYNLAIAPTNEERSHHLLYMATTCRSTFDVDPAYLPRLLHSPEDIDTLLSCALFIHALSPKDNLDKYSHPFPLWNGRVFLVVEDHLKHAILSDPSEYGIDLAVRKMFGRYQPGTQRWEQLQYPNSRWLTCKTNVNMGQSLHIAYLDLLNGRLQVDDQPVGGLPREIRESRRWQELFRDQGFLVMPSDLPGMDLTTHVIEPNYRVHFSLRDHGVVIRAERTRAREILQLVPSHILWEDLPPALVDGHVHWLNLSTKIIEIRPIERLWEESSENWRIDCTSQQYRVYKGHETLVSMRSPAWTMVSDCFRCLTHVHTLPDMSRNLMVTTSPIDSSQSAPLLRLCVVLPRYGLSFFANAENELESRDFKDMVYDENQCIGTLFGLESLLVLRPKAHIGGTLIPEALIPRRVLVPYGSCERHANSQVRIRSLEASNYHTYSVDAELGCLKGDGSSTSMYHLARLHAITSRDHWPDPLSGETGSQAALSLLQSGGCRSVMKLKALDDLSSNQYPQIKVALKEIQSRYYWKVDAHSYEGVSAGLKQAMRRAAHIFPSNVTGTSPLKGRSYDEDRNLTTLNQHVSWRITLEQLISTRPAPELPARSFFPPNVRKIRSDDIQELELLFASLPINKSDPPFQREYIALLENSAQCAREDFRVTHSAMGKDCIITLQKHYTQCRAGYLAALNTLVKTLGPTPDPIEQEFRRFGQWPSITGNSLLRCLASASPIAISARWKQCLTSLALLLLDLQRSRRLLRFALYGLEEEFSKELESEPCDGWNPDEYPDWLLIQIEGDFLIRRAQAEMAVEMMFPQSGENTVTQVNMGEGKSSVIIPTVAAALADGKQLVRVIVPKALTAQMFETLVARLGRLANRPIYHLPFSRNPEYDYDHRVISLQVDALRNLMSQCMIEHGILLVEPAHVASLKLMSVEERIYKGNPADDRLSWNLNSTHNWKRIATYLPPKLLTEDNNLVARMFRWLNSSYPRNRLRAMDIPQVDPGNNAHDASDSEPRWMGLQRWINSYARDILDESDEVLHARFQLLYTVGRKQHMDGYPDRWIIIQQVLQLVKGRAHTLSRNHRNSIEYEMGPLGSFPHLHILQGSDVGKRLIPMLVEDVMAGRLPGFDFQHFPAELHDAIRAFISDKDVLQVPHTVKRVEDYTKDSQQSHLWSGLLLLRGLLASEVLLFSLSAWRWRVNYGLANRPRLDEDPSHSRSPGPTMLAVPYRAKDVPAPNTQFGHPDITIILTCLSYYYAGLTEDQLRVSFEILQGGDDPSTEYAQWVKEYDPESLPKSVQNLGDINLRSSKQWDKVTFPLFTRNQAAIDFYLSRVVFPKEAMEYTSKLSTSSWDLAEKREKLTTGFSGTNDGKWLLPMSIAQRDLDHQKGTNAKALAYLLRPENDSYMVTHKGGERWNTFQLLQMVVKEQPEIRVLLDVGAQILDLSNQQVAKEWLSCAHSASGAIYFDHNDELMVLTRTGTTQPIHSSPLSQQLHRCVVYMDHAHTRGTDLRLPTGLRAAVTLGRGVTKDSLVQGCMRMRKLGHGHSVMFFAPLEVDRSIRAVTGKKDADVRVTTVDILCWAIQETWNDIQGRAPYWAQQGMNHKARYEALDRFCNGDLARQELSDVWLEPDQRPLADLYAPCETQNTPNTLITLDPGIRQRCKTLGVLSLPTAQFDEEQEREVNREQKREREVVLPPGAKPVDHFLHPAVVRFVKTGVLSLLHQKRAFLPVFTTLEGSTAATRDSDVWTPYILATVDFCRTVDPGSTPGTMDQYMRPVQWILSRKVDRHQVLVLLSPFEVARLLPDIRASEHVHLHLYASRTSQRMKPSDDLQFYSIPPLPSEWTPPWPLIDQLNIFAGQLYLRDYPSYLRLCHFLGVPTQDSPHANEVRWNLFNIPGSLEDNEIRFSGSPLPFVMALLGIRSRGRPFVHTHMGKILQGQALKEKDFKGLPSPEVAIGCQDGKTGSRRDGIV